MTETTDATTTTTVPALSKLDIAALRKADSVCFYLHEGQHYIRAIKEAGLDERARDPFAHDQDYRIEADGMVTDYSRDSVGDHYLYSPGPVVSCFYMVHVAQFSPEFRTAVGFLRPEDEPVIEWVRDNNSETIRSAGLHVDECHLRIRRWKKGRDGVAKGPVMLRFMMGYTITPDNSARMVRDRGGMS